MTTCELCQSAPAEHCFGDPDDHSWACGDCIAKVQEIATNVGTTHYVGDDCLGGHEDVAHSQRLSNLMPRWLATHDREIRIAALVEAARLMCVHCDEFEHPLAVRYAEDDMSREPQGIAHEVESPAGMRRIYCYATPIVERLVEMWA